MFDWVDHSAGLLFLGMCIGLVAGVWLGRSAK